MRVFSLILTLNFAFLSAFAKAEPTVYIRSDGKFVGQGEEYKRGFWIPVVQDAEPLFGADPEALYYYRKHVRYGKWFTALNWGAVGAFLTYSIVTANDPAYDYNAGTGFAIFLAPWLIGGVMGMESQQALVKAVNIMNGVPGDKAQQHFLNSPATRVASGGVFAPIWAWSF